MSDDPKCKQLANDIVLLIGLLYHGTHQHDAYILRNIMKDGLARAHKLYELAK